MREPQGLIPRYVSGGPVGHVVFVVLGAWGTVSGAVSLAGGPPFHADSIFNVVAGLWLAWTGMQSFRWRRANRSLTQAREEFKDAVRALEKAPVFYVNDDDRVVFMHATNRWPLPFRSQYLMRACEVDLDKAIRDLEDGNVANMMFETFEIHSGAAAVFHTVDGARTRINTNGDVEEVDAKNPGRWRRARGRYVALRAGLADTTEQELRQVAAQLAASRPINPETHGAGE